MTRRLTTTLAALVGLVLALPHLVAAQQCGDVNGMDGVTATDALLVLNEAVGNPVDLLCLADGCGNGTIDLGEDCDFGDLNGESCATQSLFGDGLRCGVGCVFDTSDCSATRYEDTGLGTVIDHVTGLEWQKTDDAGGITDKDNTYTWCSITVLDNYDVACADPSNPPDGTAITVFLAGLNAGETNSHRGPTTGCYAGHCDWRIPLIEELTTIYDCSVGVTCIDESAFGPTEPSRFYWSFSTFGVFKSDAQIVRFSENGVGWVGNKFGYRSVRAVRGGF